MTEGGPVGSRERILQAALELMSERGYAGTSMSMLTKRSGLPPSSTYWHFGSKEHLLAAVIEYSAKSWLESLQRWDDLAGPPEERLHRMLEMGQAGTSEQFLRLLMLLALEAPADGASIETIRRVRHSAASGFRRAYTELVGMPTTDRERLRRDEMAGFALAVTDGIFLAVQIDESIDVGRMFGFLELSFLELCRRGIEEE